MMTALSGNERARPGWRMLADFAVESRRGNERAASEETATAVGKLGLPASRLERLKTAVAEAVMNAMEHGNQYRADLPVSIQVLASAQAIVVRVTDQGGGRPIPETTAPDLEAKLAGLESPRGWGLFLIKHLVDEVRIETGEERNTVELAIRLEGDEQ